MIRSIALGLTCLFLFLTQPVAAQTPSFDCKSAKTAVEKMICRDPALSAADANMAKLYAHAQISAFGKGASNQAAAQRTWMVGRATCEDSACLLYQYKQRNGELAVSVLLSHPDAALAQLRLDYPKTAPLYEALQLYMTKPTSEPWSAPAHTAKRTKILGLLEPFYADLRNDPDKSFGLDVLSGVAASPEASIENDGNLAAVMSIINVYVGEDDSVSGAFPCAAIVKRPDMIRAAGAFFGSGLDNSLMSPDCENTLPAQPRMDALMKALSDFWGNDCYGGTIRFSIFRGYYEMVYSARIGLPALLEKGKPSSFARKGLNPQLAKAAFAELTDQYQRYQALSKIEAEKRARIWLSQIIGNAGVCEF